MADSSNKLATTIGAVAALLTAVTGLIVILTKIGVLKNTESLTPTTVATEHADAAGARGVPVNLPDPKPPEPKPAQPDPPPAPPELEYASYYNAKYGYAVVYPKALLFPEKEAAYGQRFKSLDGNVTLNVLSVDNTAHDTPASAYADMIHTLTTGTPLTIVKQALEPKGFAIDTKNGPRLSHMKLVLNDKYYRLLSMDYNESDRPVFDAVWTHIAAAFER
ncbi:MAG TPA: hypothetical protein VFP91_12355 [Vicinamibacterales bacterium]|nr:hypothetical protein [Vicinamibacterales bacterium]